MKHAGERPSGARVRVRGFAMALLLNGFLLVALAFVALGDTSSTSTPSPGDTEAPASREGAGAEPVDCATMLAATIQAHYETVNDFSADFEQQTKSVTLASASLGDDALSTGTVVFSKPGKMRWQYLAPTPSQVISNGSVLWIFDSVAREAQRLPVTEGYLTGAALEFLIGDGEILEDFDVTAASCEPNARNAVQLKLLPKQAAGYESLSLEAASDTGEIYVTSLVDLFGNETRISFKNTKTNLAPDATHFDFEVPADVRVFDMVVEP
ncbi:MAG: outer membrane lipoprotein carrier protein [Myxococcota bacterium]|jgi:outer membrane lipoprotein carrier protein